MDLNQLRTFLHLARAGSLSRVADEMHIAQPALSRRIRLLEQEIGLRLFVRHRRGMELTDAGRRLAGELDQPLQALKTIISSVKEDQDIGGHVSIGIIPTASAIVSRPLLRRIAAEKLNITLRIEVAYAGHLVKWLHNGDIDGAILFGSGSELHIAQSDLLTERLMLIGPRDFPFANLPSVEFKVLDGVPLVAPSQGHSLRVLAEQAAGRANIQLNIPYEADSFEILKGMVCEGFGYTILPFSAVAAEVRQGVLAATPIRKPTVSRRVIMAFGRDRIRSKAVCTVFQMLQAETAKLVQNGDWAEASLMFQPEQNGG